VLRRFAARVDAFAKWSRRTFIAVIQIKQNLPFAKTTDG